MSNLLCWKRGSYAHMHTPVVSYFRSGRSGLALGVSIKYIYMPLYPYDLV